MLDVTTYNLLMDVMGAYYGAMGKVRAQLDPPLADLPPLLQVRGGYAESPGWYMIQAAEFTPEPLTVEGLRVRDIYAAPRLVQALLELLASEQWLDRRGDDYFLTAAGHAIVAQLQERSTRMIACLAPLPEEELTRLEGLTHRIIEAALHVDTPPGSWCLRHSRQRAPDEDAPSIHQLFHYLSDFNAFRDDAHMAAFQPHEPQGYRWEAFTLVVEEQATTAAALFAQLAYRGYSVGEFAAALAVLAERGWLHQSAETGAYQATAAGHAVRAEIEQQTDRYFYGPWATLTPAEIDELLALLVALRDGLQGQPE